MNDRMDGRKVLVTQAEDYMGPAIAELFEAEGAQVTRVHGVVESVAQVATMLEEAGDLDVVIANLARDPTSTPVAEIEDDRWQALFATLVDPLMWLVRAAAPAMVARGGGKIVAVADHMGGVARETGLDIPALVSWAAEHRTVAGFPDADAFEGSDQALKRNSLGKEIHAESYVGRRAGSRK